MRVVDHEPAFWFLFEADGALLLDVSCSQSFVGYSVMIPLSAPEAERYRAEGRAYLSSLAERISDAGMGSDLQKRDVSRTYGPQALEAVRTWRGQDG